MNPNQEPNNDWIALLLIAALGTALIVGALLFAAGAFIDSGEGKGSSLQFGPGR